MPSGIIFIPFFTPMPYTDVQQLERRIDQYFHNFECRLAILYAHPDDACPSEVSAQVTDRSKEPPTLSGLIYFLGYDSRAKFEKLARGKTRFAPALRRARLRVEAAYERSLHKPSPGGAIFALKNMGWGDGKDNDIHEPEPAKNLNITYHPNTPPTAASERDVAMG